MFIVNFKKITCPSSSFKSEELQMGISPVIGQRNSSSHAKKRLPMNFCISKLIKNSVKDDYELLTNSLIEEKITQSDVEWNGNNVVEHDEKRKNVLDHIPHRGSMIGI